jgi:plastocyanin
MSIPLGIPIMIMMAVAMGCVGLPESSRTGQAHRVSISDRDISPKDLTVQSCDEILFSNSGPTQVWVYFANDHWNALSCRRGFSYFWGNEESAAVQPNASVSLCFSTPGIYGYWVQPRRTDRGGAPQGQLSRQDAMPGAIIVTPDRP